jgi:tRNA-dihydrouridine synthase
MQAAVRGEAIAADPAPSERWRSALMHYRAALAHYGTELGRRVVRKHLGWYAESAGAHRSLRDALVRSSDPEHLLMRLAGGYDAAKEFEEAA